MKKIGLLGLLCALSLFVHAQTQTPSEFATYSETMNAKVQEASKASDRPQLIGLLTEWAGAYEKLTPVDQKNFATYLQSLYYNLASLHAAEGNRSQAVKYFEKAIDAGYSNYANAVSDSTLLSLRKDKDFKAAMQRLRLKSDYRYILKNCGKYRKDAHPAFPSFTYQAGSMPDLQAFREKFNLDSIVGSGDEVSRIKNLLHWVHNLIRHDGNSSNPPSRNATDLIEVCRKENRGVNCRMLATVLRDAYQAEGFPARVVTCLPKDTTDFDCHVINAVWSASLQKWLWMDPTNNAYVSDERGNLLSIEEVRDRLVHDKPVVLNEDANWNNKVKQTRENYLYGYMSKNLYWLQCSVKSEWDLETIKNGKGAITYVNLYPADYSTIAGEKEKVTSRQVIYATGDEKLFWQRPNNQVTPAQ